MLRSLRIIIELLAGMIGILTVLGVCALWVLSANPLNSEFMTPYIISGIEQLLPDSHAQIGRSQLSWDNVDRDLVMHVDGVAIKNANDAMIAEIPNLDFHLSIFGVLLGEFLPTEFIVDHPQLHLERRIDNKVYFGGMSATSTSSDDTLATLRMIANTLPHAYFLRNIEIRNAVLDIEDHVTSKTWSVSLPEINLVKKHGNLSGHVLIVLTQNDASETIETHYVYDRSKNLHRLITRFDNITPAKLAGGHPEVVGLAEAHEIDLPLTGEIEAVFDKDLHLATGSIKVQGDRGTLNIPELWNQPLPIETVDFEADFDRASNHLAIPVAAIDFGGPKLDLKLSGKPSGTPGRDMDIDVNVHMQSVPFDQYGRLWPKPFIPTPAAWIKTHLTKGAFDDGRAEVKASIVWKDLSDIQLASGGGHITASHVTVSYIQGMPPIEDVKADADFDLDKMSVQISSGGIGNIHVTPFTLVMYDFQQDTQRITIPLKLSGPLPDIMALIDNPPLHYAAAIDLKPDEMTGQADVDVDLEFPLIQTLVMKDIAVKASASVTNLASTKLLDGIDLSQGRLALLVDNKGFTAKGPINVKSVPFQVTWAESFDVTAKKPMRQVTATGSFKDDQFKAWGLTALGGSRGTTLVTLQLNQKALKNKEFSGDVDMTAADIHFDQMNWRKPLGIPAYLKFKAAITEAGDINITSILMHGPEADIKGTAVVDSDGTVEALNLDPFRLGRTDAALTFSRPDDDGQVLRFEAYGNTLDISGLRGGKDPDHSAPQPKEYDIKVDKLYTNTNGFIGQAQGFAIRDAEGWSEISLHGMDDGDHKLDIDLSKSDNRRVFSILCDDFGKALKGLGFSDSVSNGDLKIRGTSLPDTPRVIEGTVKIGEFEVRNLPAMVVLLNATSPFGLFGILTDSTSFSSMRGHFRWQGDAIELKDVEAAGSSIGMNIQGKVDMNTGMANLNGTLVPFSSVNSVIGAIPLLGDILTGGSGGGVLAVAYNISGTLADPKVNVSPESLLTPGFLRTFFFGGDDATPLADPKVLPNSSSN